MQIIKKIKNILQKKIRAFSLLETIISIGITGIIIIGTSSLWITFNKIQEKKINTYKYEKIKQAMENFLIQKGRIPNASININGLEENHNYCGYVPYKTLGLNKSYMYDYNKKPFKYIVNQFFTRTNISLIRPLSCPPIIKQQETSFHRIYTYENNEIHLYDLIAHTVPDLDIIENKSSVIDNQDYFYILPPIKKFKDLIELREWSNNSKEKLNKYKTSNTIAWILISLKQENKSSNEENNTNNKKIFYINNKDTIFYQTRFDMAAQTEFNCTPEPIYLDD